MITLSILIASYNRTDDLEKCLTSLTRQTSKPDEINVVYRVEDIATLALLKKMHRLLGPILSWHSIEQPGTVAARNLGLEKTTSDIVAMIDDDTEPDIDWVAKIKQHFSSNDRLGGLGGRDTMWIDGIPDLGQREIVGKLQWFGRVIGNHHLGYGPLRMVDVLKGANMSFRMSALNGLRFNKRLRGDGAESWEDIDFSLSVKRAGWILLYDPELNIRHYQGCRPEVRHYATLSSLSGRERYNYKCMCYNEVIALWPSLSCFGKMSYIIFSIFIGTRVAPGGLQMIRFSRRLGIASVDRFFLCQIGKFNALLSILKIKFGLVP